MLPDGLAIPPTGLADQLFVMSGKLTNNPVDGSAAPNIGLTELGNEPVVNCSCCSNTVNPKSIKLPYAPPGLYDVLIAYTSPVAGI
jgi:hypothetical protein